MRTVHLLLLMQGMVGAFDTLWYHEFRARLPNQPSARRELRLHASRDAIYAMLLGTLGWLAWQVRWLGSSWPCLRARLRSRSPTSTSRRTVEPSYGAFLAHLLPEIWQWMRAPTSFAVVQPVSPTAWVLGIMGIGVLLSGVRDAIASATLRSPNQPLQPTSGWLE